MGRGIRLSDVAFLGRVGNQGFSPPSPGNLKLWLKPESLSALANNDPVSVWPDSSGNGNDLGNAVGTEPTYKTNLLNGVAGVQFDGINDKMSRAVLTTSTIYSMFVVFKFDSAVGTYMLIRNGNAGGYGLLADTSNRAILHRVVATLSDGTITSNAELWSAVRTSAPLAKLWVNGSNVAITNDTSNVNAPDSTFFLGCFAPGFFHLPGRIFEVALYDTDLSDSNRQLWEAYLMAKYAL